MVIKQKHLVEFQIYYLLIVEMLIDLLHFPDIIRYLLDVNLIFMFFMALPKIRDIINDKPIKRLSAYIFGYMFAITAFSVIRRTPLGQIFWAVRNNYFYIIFFFICAYTLKKADFNRIITNVVRLQALNLACVLYEFIILGHFGDTVGGMFGATIGCNGYLNVYLCVITSFVVVQYANKKTSIWKVFYIVLSSMVIATISELKFYFFELVIIAIVSISLSSINVKNGMIVIVAVMAIFVGIQVLTAINPWSADLIQDFDGLNEYTRTTYGGTVIARGTPFSQINDYFFKDNVFYNIFGYGSGACEDSVSFSWANSDFATRYRDLGYRNLSTSMLFVETGYVGLIAFLGIFIGIFVTCQRLKEKYSDLRNVYAFTQAITVVAIMNIWYNSTIRREIAFLTFFCLSAFIIFTRDKATQIAKNNENSPEVPVKKSYIKKKNKRVFN